MIREAIIKIVDKQDLTYDEAYQVMNEIMSGQTSPTQNAAFLAALSTKSTKAETVDEIAGCAAAMRDHAMKVPNDLDLLEIVGTGGDGRSSFNCSTGTALTLAGMGYQVVKHGNRAVSSKCGSADALEGLGVNLDVNPAEVGNILRDRNFVFLFAQRFHPCFRNIAPIRNELGIRTLFNLLGPLINPSRPTHILLGVARPNLVKLMAETLAQSSVHRAAVVCGAGGYDEITPIGPNEMIILDNGELEPLTLDPADYGIPACTPEDLAVTKPSPSSANSSPGAAPKPCATCSPSTSA